MSEHTQQGNIGGSQEGDEYPNKRRKPSVNTTEVSARSPRLAATLTTATLNPPPNSQAFTASTPTSTHRPPTTAISSLVHSNTNSDLPFRRRPVDNSAPETFARPYSPARSHTSTTSVHPSQQTTLVQSSDSDPLTRRPPRLPSPVSVPLRSYPQSTSNPLIPPFPLPTLHSLSPVRDLNIRRQDERRPYTASEPYTRSPLFPDLPASSRPAGVVGQSQMNERAVYFSAQEVTSSRDQTFDPRRSMSSASGPSRDGGRGSPSRESSEAWFSLGSMEPVDMRQWDERDRVSYQRGYSDALRAVQRGVVGVNGKQCKRA